MKSGAISGKTSKKESAIDSPEDHSQFEVISDGEIRTGEDLCEKIRGYYSGANLDLVEKSYQFSKQAHAGQIRRSGEPYIHHPLGVASILADLRLDLATIATGLLHDTVEDTPITLDQISLKFGPVIAELVDGVTKISQMHFRNTHEKQGENIRKMIVAMGKDVRVILVKLADRLHNMRTLSHMPPAKQMRISQETLDIYAPLASRLGISSIKVELEDLSFRYSQPDQFYALVQKVVKKKRERERYIDEVKKLLSTKFQEMKFKFVIQGRPKHLYSIYRKMKLQNLEYEQVYDILAFRVIVQSISECYECLGLIHSMWRPIPGRFKDFIAMPKANRYQSLHTTVIGPGGERIEIQMRTEEMHLIAERGIAAHWKYKELDRVDQTTVDKFDWLRELVTRHQQTPNSDEFLESVKTELFESEIYVFTPTGELKEFPEGATPLDFAYSIHTDVGNHCVGARVNGKIVPLKHKLKSGDSVEIQTSKTQSPSKDWLKYCTTSRAKSKIRAFVKSEQRRRAAEVGREMLDKAFRRLGVSGEKELSRTDLSQLFKDSNVSDLNDLYVKVGYGNLTSQEITDRVCPNKNPVEKDQPSFFDKVFRSAAQKTKKTSALIQIQGMTDILVRYGRCCNPIPGDPIVGFITRGRGITVHRVDCPKAFEFDQKRRIDVGWTHQEGIQGQERQARVRVISHNLPGLLQRISEAFAGQGINILNGQIRTTRDNKSACVFDVSVLDTNQLFRVMQELQKIDGIIGVTRITRG